ncbi:MAG: choice-of-anchor B family protein [Saprospiraceae bacterium]|nr:choice-of-anchor B family protein [Candidatus Vicinibacter affinis]MBK7695236.1 choice-of-anchor B family protein [Candidatus Vicinibacter affinis]
MNIIYYLNNLFILLCFSATLSAQSGWNMQVRALVKPPENCSSIWGHTTGNGKELALLGTAEGVRIYDLSLPDQPKEILFIQSNPCLWRELKTSGDFAYVSSECDDGLLIIDLRNPDSIQHKFVFDILNADGDSFRVTNAHTLYVDEKGFIYLSGAREVGAGFAILDPSFDPWQPQLIFNQNGDYMHEVHVWEDVLYGAELFNGVFSIWDIKDRKAPKRIADQRTAFTFTHSVWLDQKQKILYTADETNGALVEAWDVSDPYFIRKKDQFRVGFGADPYHIPHNVFHHQDHLYISWYTEGVRVLDTRRPDNLVEVGYFDTYPGKLSGFHGCWSVYPFFKSGLIIASDIETGMFVMEFNGTRAAYLAGKVADKATNLPIYDAHISLKPLNGPNKIQSNSDLKGNYKMGSGDNGTHEITVSKAGYQIYRKNIDLFTDSLITLDILMEELPKSSIKITLNDAQTGNVIPDAEVQIWTDQLSYSGKTDSNGLCLIDQIYHGQYVLLCGKWSYLHKGDSNLVISGYHEKNYTLSIGFEDQFVLHHDWKIISDDSIVSWQYGNLSELFPPPSNYPSKDISGDFGDQCIYTNNFGDTDSKYRLNGHLYLMSPSMNLNPYDEIQLSYYPWAYGGWDDAIMECYLQMDDEKIFIENIPLNLKGNFNPKTDRKIKVKGIKRDSVRFVFHLWNNPDSSMYAISLKAALDGFKLVGSLPNKTISPTKDAIEIFPNPFHDHFLLNNHFEDKMILKLFSGTGEFISRKILFPGENFIPLNKTLSSGLIFYQVADQLGKIISSGKLIQINN